MFSSLKERLQEKKATGVSGPHSTSPRSPPVQTAQPLLPSKEIDMQHDPTLEDPYLLSIHTILHSRKREREDSTQQVSRVPPMARSSGVPLSGKEIAHTIATRADETVEGQVDHSDPPTTSPGTIAPEESSTIPPLSSAVPSGALLKEEEILSQRKLALDALAMCMHSTSLFWSSGEVGSCTNTQTVSILPSLWKLPNCVESYLYRLFLGDEQGAEWEAKHNTFTEAEEFELLKSIREESNDDREVFPFVSDSNRVDIKTSKPGLATANKPIGGHAKCCIELARLIHALWYLVTAHWRHAVLGQASTSTESSSLSCSAGWCYFVYLHEHHMLPENIKLTKGHEVAVQLDIWKGAQRVRHHALKLLGLLVKDYRTMLSGTNRSSNLDQTASMRSSGNVKKAPHSNSLCMLCPECNCNKSTFLIPPEVRQSLHEIIVKNVQCQQNFTASRQAYTDLTLGTANWKVGLFSGGEVHMRRSIERVERNRIVHLLNNERAMQMLHSIRELMNLAEKNLTPAEQADFFTPSARSPS